MHAVRFGGGGGGGGKGEEEREIRRKKKREHSLPLVFLAIPVTPLERKE